MVTKQVQHLDATEDAEYAVITSSSGLSVKMRPGIDGRDTVIPAWANCEGVSHGVNDNLTAKCSGRLDEPIPSLLICV